MFKRAKRAAKVLRAKPKKRAKPKFEAGLPIFHGKTSESLWRAICRVEWDSDVGKAFYALGQGCQELESRVERLERQQHSESEKWGVK